MNELSPSVHWEEIINETSKDQSEPQNNIYLSSSDLTLRLKVLFYEDIGIIDYCYNGMCDNCRIYERPVSSTQSEKGLNLPSCLKM